MITVRYFAAAREAAGRAEETVVAVTVAMLRAELGRRHGPRLAEVLAVSSLMCAGRRLEEMDRLPSGAEVDVLPPFAGG